MKVSWQEIIRRMELGEVGHQERLLQASSDPKTPWWTRRDYILHRPMAHSADLTYVNDGTPVQGRARLGWHSRRCAIELAIARLRDPEDRRLLENRNQSKFGSPTVPSIQWLMDQAKACGGDETAQYEGVLRWVLRPDLYSYRWRESGGEDFKRLKRDQKGDPHLSKGKVAYSGTGDPEYPLCTDKDGKMWRIRVNEFPDLPLYTLLINDDEVMDFDNWPRNWTRPKMSS
jgi:hypothetical protein